jgi:1-aminocyclopropane-1-carboxylate deaminase
MKLAPWLNRVKEKALKGILTKGGPYSNHVHAAAFAALEHNLQCTLVIKANQDMLTPTLEDATRWTAKIVYAPSDFEDDEKWERLAIVEQLQFIPMGGEGPGATEGVTKFFKSLKLTKVDHVICPVGTGTTLSGIAATPIYTKSLTGINPGIKDDFQSLINSCNKNNGRTVEIIRDPALGKFGKFPTWLPALMNEWFENWQLPTDIIYTGKMFYSFFEILKENRFREGESIMLVHTGGLQGNCSLPKGSLVF